MGQVLYLVYNIKGGINMAIEINQTAGTLLQSYREILRSKQIIFNLTDDQIEEMDLEVVFNTKHGKSETQQVIKGTEHGVLIIIKMLSKENYYNESINIEIEDVNIIL